MLESKLCQAVIEAVQNLYGLQLAEKDVSLQKTRKEFEGEFTIAVFPFVRVSKKSPEATATEIGQYVKDNLTEVADFNVIKGFLNLQITKEYWLKFLSTHQNEANFGFTKTEESEVVMIEYSSPNTNKPLHLGHVRNNLLGWSVAQILKANGKNVVKVNLVNDRGIHICKSMLAWQKWGNSETPASSGLKGDHLAGKYYVLFDKYYRAEVAEMIATGIEKEIAEKQAPLMLAAQEMLRKWEAKDEVIIKLWETMNAWVYEGFEQTYHRMGIDFDKTYYESSTYLLGKLIVEKGLSDGKLIRKADQSVWADLTADGLDEKLLLRADGTSVYMTQDLGTAHLRHEEYQPKQMFYVVGNEQNYHFDVLKLVLHKLGYKWSDNIYHLSYGMVELPAGKMKSREGTVVDADDLMDEMEKTAYEKALELGKIDDFENEEAKQLYATIAMGALKYFILKVDPQKNMLFNPDESIDFNGNTGPFIQYTHARIKSLLKKASSDLCNIAADIEILPKEKEIIRLLHEYPSVIKLAGENRSPALIANYAFELAKEYNGFYQEITILKEENDDLRNFRLSLSVFTANTIKSAMGLLGIEVPERM
ncbi:MAG: arginine--tRNA ligase [Bacteroidetes bacterium]|nr:arginine--tRNA ligase [Bacteroidota bacterium]